MRSVAPDPNHSPSDRSRPVLAAESADLSRTDRSVLLFSYRGNRSQILNRKKEQEMNFLKAAPTVLCAAVIATAFSPSVKADEWNQKTVITFSQPVETPGVHMKGWAVLPRRHLCFQASGLASPTAISSRSSTRTKRWCTPRSWQSQTIVSGPPAKQCSPLERRRPASRMCCGHGSIRAKTLARSSYIRRNRALELAKVTNSPVLYMPAEIPVEVEAPITSPEEPVVVQLKQAPVHGSETHWRRR